MDDDRRGVFGVEMTTRLAPRRARPDDDEDDEESTNAAAAAAITAAATDDEVVTVDLRTIPELLSEQRGHWCQPPRRLSIEVSPQWPHPNNMFPMISHYHRKSSCGVTFPRALDFPNIRSWKNCIIPQEQLTRMFRAKRSFTLRRRILFIISNIQAKKKNNHNRKTLKRARIRLAMKRLW